MMVLVVLVMIVLVVVVDGVGIGCGGFGDCVLFPFISYIFKSSFYFKQCCNMAIDKKLQKQQKTSKTSYIVCIHSVHSLIVSGKAMRCFTCADCSWNSLTSSNNPSSLILDVLSGQSLRCRFRILQYWFSGSLSLAHRFVIAFSLTQHLTITSSVSATMAYSSRLRVRSTAHVTIALGKQFTYIFLSIPVCKMDTRL